MDKKCEVCGKILKEKIDIYNRDGHTLCLDCYNNTIGYCPYCGKRIRFEDETEYGLDLNRYAICIDCLKENEYVFCLDLLIWTKKEDAYTNGRGEYFYRSDMKKSPWLD